MRNKSHLCNVSIQLCTPVVFCPLFWKQKKSNDCVLLKVQTTRWARSQFACFQQCFYQVICSPSLTSCSWKRVWFFPFLLKRSRRAVVRYFQFSGSFDSGVTNIVQRECGMTSGATLSPPLYFEFASDDLFESSSELCTVKAIQDRIGCRISKDNQLREPPQFIAFVGVKIP